MANGIKIGLFLFFALNEAGARSFCGDAFVSKRSPLKKYLQTEPKKSLTRSLLEGYRIIQKPFQIGRKKQWRELEKGLADDFMDFLERAPTEQEKRSLRFLSSRFMEEGLKKTPEIVEFVNGLSGEKAALFQPIAEAILATYGKYLPAALKSGGNYEENDWERINFILKSIAEFNINDAEFSLYKIKRAIKGRYSFREYILCRRG